MNSTSKKPELDAILTKLQSHKDVPLVARPLNPLAQSMSLNDLQLDFKRAEKLIDSHPDREDKGLVVYRGQGRDLPHVLLEIGRLREETFRTVGEGTGYSRDMDSFDQYYDQFFAFDKAKGEITGGYRIGRVDEILRAHGQAGVYTNTLFNLENLLNTDFKEGTLEAGRSFVRPEFQRGASLLLIWMGLGHFIAANPRYKYLMGPVSISNEFKENSKQLMVSYLMKRHPHEKSNLVTSKNPPKFDSNLSPEELTELVEGALNLSNLQDFVRQAEGNPKAQIPQLIRLYLELGVRFLTFHKDDDFNSIDGLIWLDLREVPRNLLDRYMGPEGAAAYLRHHGQ